MRLYIVFYLGRAKGYEDERTVQFFTRKKSAMEYYLDELRRAKHEANYANRNGMVYWGIARICESGRVLDYGTEKEYARFEWSDN